MVFWIYFSFMGSKNSNHLTISSLLLLLYALFLPLITSVPLLAFFLLIIDTFLESRVECNFIQKLIFTRKITFYSPHNTTITVVKEIPIFFSQKEIIKYENLNFGTFLPNAEKKWLHQEIKQYFDLKNP